MADWILIAVGVSLIVFAGRFLFVTMTRGRATDLLERASDGDLVEGRVDELDGWLRRWLVRAGYRSSTAPSVFLIWATTALMIGVVVATVIWRSELLESGVVGLDSAPGGFAALLIPVLYAAPAILALIVAGIPWLVVRSVRRRRVQEIEIELPVTLELMASLGESGLGFDAAIERIAAEGRGEGFLAEEFDLYRREIMTGMSRSGALRRLARRISVPALNMFASALIQADQVGASVANTLRTQANDLRDRRRQQAQGRAQALPVKLVVPLVACFLPAIFVITIGPAFSQLFRIIDSITR